MFEEYSYKNSLIIFKYWISFGWGVFNWFLPVGCFRNFHLNKSDYIGIRLPQLSLCWLTLAKFLFRQKQLYWYTVLDNTCKNFHLDKSNYIGILCWIIFVKYHTIVDKSLQELNILLRDGLTHKLAGYFATNIQAGRGGSSLNPPPQEF